MPRILIAGARGTLVYRHFADYIDYGDADELRLVDGRRASLIPGSQFPTALAVAGSRVAFAPSGRSIGIPWHGGPTWSPDGASVAFPGALYVSGQDEPAESGAYVVASVGGEATKLFGLKAEELDWSPDGRRFALVLPTGAPDSEGSREGEIYTGPDRMGRTSRSSRPAIRRSGRPTGDRSHSSSQEHRQAYTSLKLRLEHSGGSPLGMPRRGRRTEASSQWPEMVRSSSWTRETKSASCRACTTTSRAL